MWTNDVYHWNHFYHDHGIVITQDTPCNKIDISIGINVKIL